MNLNGLWEYSVRSAAEGAPQQRDVLDKILVPFPVESALSSVRKRIERGQYLWYRREFALPEGWKDKRVLLHFGAVDWACNVGVNGRTVGEHTGGYDPITIDITDALNAAGAQQLTVRVADPTDRDVQPRGKQVSKPGGIYYTPTTGIWQTVWLEAVPAVRIEGLKIVPGASVEEVLITTSRTPGGLRGSTLRLTATDGNRVVAEATGHPGELISLKPADPKLWSPDNPHLYDLKVDLLENGQVIDSVQSYFGLRQISLGKDAAGRTVILFNGKPLFQVGLLDQGFWPDGLYTAPTDAALRFDIEQTKRLGYNLIRKHVKVEPDRWYYWADKLGILVWQDMPSGDKSIPPNRPDLVRTPESAAIYERELKTMLDKLQMHPSIIMWVVFNEGWGQFDTQRITAWTKEYDPTRLVNCASGWNDHPGVGDVHDIHVYPGPGAPVVEEKRAIVLGEFGGLGLKIDGHTWEQKTWGYRGATDTEDLTRKYERLLAQAWKLHREKGLSACVYTQTTDVETEANGVFTYDRAVLKMDAARLTAINRGDNSRMPKSISLAPTSEKEPQTYRYTLTQPKGDWLSPTFDDSKWIEALGGFGTAITPGAVVGTEWKSNAIWLRRIVTLPEGQIHSPYLVVHHDEDAEIYINGLPATKLPGFTTSYEEVNIRPEAAKALKSGRNVIAIHCKQTRGGQFIDLGLIDYLLR